MTRTNKGKHALGGVRDEAYGTRGHPIVACRSAPLIRHGRPIAYIWNRT